MPPHMMVEKKMTSEDLFKQSQKLLSQANQLESDPEVAKTKQGREKIASKIAQSMKIFKQVKKETPDEGDFGADLLKMSKSLLK